MGFTLEGEFQARPRQEGEDPEDYRQEIPMAEDEGEVQQEILEDQQAVGEEEVDKVVVEPFSVDKVVVNGIELTSTSSLTSLRAACTFRHLDFWIEVEVL